jgi:hypothetical protein
MGFADGHEVVGEWAAWIVVLTAAAAVGFETVAAEHSGL